MTRSDHEPRSARLERALEVFLARAGEARPEAEDEFLARHDDLREVLEPLLAERAAAGDAARADGSAAGDAGGDTDTPERAFGDFRLVRKIGQGGMGEVYEAWQRSLDRRVALKILPLPADLDPEALARFRREATAAARLRHPNIVEVLGSGSVDGRHWYAMELVDGAPLSRCRERFQAPAAAIALTAQIADALQHAHGAGLVHRDVKPGNVLVRADGSAVLTDFGLVSDAQLPTVTQQGAFLGTLEYAAPEQIRGESVDARADVWALGVVLYELVAGRHPFAANGPRAVADRIQRDEPADLRRIAPAAGADLAAVVQRCLHKDREQRYRGAAALLADLRALAAGDPVTARLPSARERVLRWARREPWRATAVVLATVAIPALSLLVGYVVAKAPALRAAEADAVRARHEELLADAWGAIADGEGARARELLAMAGRLVPDDPEAVVASVGQRIRTGDAAGALAEIDAWVQRAGTPSPVIERVRADALEALGRPAGAAALRAAVGEPDEALECFVAAASTFGRERFGNDDPARFVEPARLCERAVLLSSRPRASFLVLWLRAAHLTDDEPAQQRARVALGHHFGDRAFARRQLAGMLVQRDPAGAVVALRSLLAESPEQPGSLFYNLGLALEKSGDIAGAIAEYRRATERDPTHARAFNNLGTLLRERGDRAEAIEAFRRTTAIAPRYARGWNNLGITLRAQGDLDGALAALERAVAIDPAYAIAQYNLGNVHRQRGDSALAVAAFRAAVAAQPDYVKAHGNLGNALRESGDLAGAVAAYRRNTELAPNDLIGWHNLADTARMVGDREVALAAAERTIEVAPRSPDAFRVHALVLLEEYGAPVAAADGARALASIERAIELDADGRPDLRVLRARAKAASGARDEAIRELRELRSGLGDSDDDSKVRARVDELLAEYGGGR